MKTIEFVIDLILALSVNLGSIVIAYNFEILKYFIGEKNSFSSNVGLYVVILTFIERKIRDFINDKKVKVLTDLSIRRDDEYSLRQSIRLRENTPRKIYLRIVIYGRGENIRAKYICLDFPKGVTAECVKLRGVKNDGENKLLIPVENICNYKNMCIEIQLLQSVQSISGASLVLCSLDKCSLWTRLETNQLSVSVS